MVAALEELADYADDLDQANDMYIIGGLQICSAFLKHHDPDFQALACEIIGNAIQNNERIVQFAADTFVLKELIKMVEGGSKEADTVRVKALYALSCMVRGNEGALLKFNELEGYNVLIIALQSGVGKLRTKALFLISNICISFPDQCEVYYSMGVLEQVLAQLAPPAPGSPDLLTSLEIIHSLGTECSGGLPSGTCEKLKKVSGWLEEGVHVEERAVCEKLLELCKRPGSAGVDR